MFYCSALSIGSKGESMFAPHNDYNYITTELQPDCNQVLLIARVVGTHFYARGSPQDLCVQCNQAMLRGKRDGLGAIGRAQLAHNRANMEFGGALTDDEVGGDL